MKIVKTEFHDLFVIEYASYKDNRGEFVKTIHEKTFAEHGLEWKFTESFYSVSDQHVIRGMHYQKPPADHAKLVYVITGAIIDVVLDIRQSSPTFGQAFSVELSAENRKGIYIGKGFAHGFLALQKGTTVEYHTTTSQDKEAEGGIKYDSFGFNWGIDKPILSIRDAAFEGFTSSKQYF